MPYITLIDDNFTRADTTPGAANSTNGVGNGWTDYAGGSWQIVGNVLEGGNVTGLTGITSPLYHSSSASITNGRVRCYANGSDAAHERGGVARFAPASGGSGYLGFVYNNIGFYFIKRVAGTETILVNGAPIGVPLPAGYVTDFTVQQVDSAHTQLTLAVYDPADLTTPLAATSYTDNEASLQNAAGILGVSGEYSGWHAARVILQEASNVLSATSFVVQPFRTVAQLTAQAATGGVLPLAYQWHRSTASGFTPASGTAIPGAAALTYTDAGLSPGTPYYYRLLVSDAAGAFGEYAEVGATTFVADLGRSAVLVHIGDSISAGTGATALNAVSTEIATLNAGGFRAATYNAGVSGSTTADWLPTGGFLPPVLARIAAMGADTVSIMLGTNDAKASVRTSFADYAAHLSAIINACLAAGAGRVILNEPPCINPGVYGDGSDFDAVAANVQLPGYIAQLGALANGTTILRGSTRTYAHFHAAADQLLDGVHPNQAGHTWLGQEWALALLGQIAEPHAGGVVHGGFFF